MRTISVVLLLLATGAATAVEMGAILGTWSTEDRYGNSDGIIEIAREGDEFIGTVVWVKYTVYPAEDRQGMAGQPIRDRENPDASLRARPILGLAILRGLRFDGEGWSDGYIYSPRQGASYRAQAWLEDLETLKVRGYIGMPMFGKTATWKRAKVPDS